MRVWLGEPTLPLSASTTREAVRPQTPLSSVAPSRPDVARRQLPVLCGDLVGSTALATQRASRETCAMVLARGEGQSAPSLGERACRLWLSPGARGGCAAGERGAGCATPWGNARGA
jgi:hypothetical protein